MNDDTSRRRVLRTGAAALAAGTGLGAVGSATASNGENGNGKQFGRVWANGVLWRTNVVTVLDEEPDPGDVIYFVNDGTAASLPPTAASTTAVRRSSPSPRPEIGTGTADSGSTTAHSWPTA